LLLSCGLVVFPFIGGIAEGSSTTTPSAAASSGGGAGCTYFGGSQHDTCDGNTETINNGGDDSSGNAISLGVGIGIGVPSFLVALVGVIIMFYRKHKKNQAERRAVAADK
jgi:hypothetical protein